MNDKRISYDSDVDKKKVGSRIKNIRLQNNMTMEELGNKLSASKGAVYNWERGKNLPNKARLNSIAELGNVSVNYILHGKDDEIINLELYDYLKREYDLLLNQFKNDELYDDDVAFTRAENYVKEFIEKYKNYTFKDYKFDTETSNKKRGDNRDYSKKPINEEDYIEFKKYLQTSIIRKFHEIYITTEQINQKRKNEYSSKYLADIDGDIEDLRQLIYNLFYRKNSEEELEFYKKIKPLFRKFRKMIVDITKEK